jgi:hypothetical protein
MRVLVGIFALVFTVGLAKVCGAFRFVDMMICGYGWALAEGGCWCRGKIDAPLKAQLK